MRSTPTRRAVSSAAVVGLVGVAGALPAAATAQTGPVTAPRTQSHRAIIAELDEVFVQAEAVTAWPEGMCDATYGKIARLSAQLVGATEGNKRLTQLHRDAQILNRQATALIPECVPFDAGQRVAQMENRYICVDMQLWMNQLQFDLDHPRNYLAPTKTRGKVTKVTNPADRAKASLKKYRDCTEFYCPTYVVAPKGTYMMGGTPEEWASTSSSTAATGSPRGTR